MDELQKSCIAPDIIKFNPLRHSSPIMIRKQTHIRMSHTRGGAQAKQAVSPGISN